MTKKITLPLLLVLLFTWGCSQSKSVGTKDAAPLPPDMTVFLKNNIHVQMRTDRKGREVYRASYANFTDPGQGHMIIPVNTPVTIRTAGSWRGKEILITTADGKEIHFEFNSRNMKMKPEEYFNIITSPRKTNLNRFSSIDRKGIASGRPYVGMSKNGIQTALGFPAVHRTPSLTDNIWTYWTNRFVTTAVEFDARGKVTQIR
jgi:hypothetical protein